MIGSNGEYGPIFGELAGLAINDGYVGPSIRTNHFPYQFESNEFNCADYITFSVDNKEAMRIEKDGVFCFGKKIAGPQQDFDPRFPLLRKLLQSY
jgi:hypothetical protein